MALLCSSGWSGGLESSDSLVSAFWGNSPHPSSASVFCHVSWTLSGSVIWVLIVSPAIEDQLLKISPVVTMSSTQGLSHPHFYWLERLTFCYNYVFTSFCLFSNFQNCLAIREKCMGNSASPFKKKTTILKMKKIPCRPQVRKFQHHKTFLKK